MQTHTHTYIHRHTQTHIHTHSRTHTFIGANAVALGRDEGRGGGQTEEVRVHECVWGVGWGVVRKVVLGPTAEHVHTRTCLLVRAGRRWIPCGSNTKKTVRATTATITTTAMINTTSSSPHPPPSPAHKDEHVWHSDWVHPLLPLPPPSLPSSRPLLFNTALFLSGNYFPNAP